MRVLVSSTAAPCSTGPEQMCCNEPSRRIVPGQRLFRWSVQPVAGAGVQMTLKKVRPS